MGNRNKNIGLVLYSACSGSFSSDCVWSVAEVGGRSSVVGPALGIGHLSQRLRGSKRQARRRLRVQFYSEDLEQVWMFEVGLLFY